MHSAVHPNPSQAILILAAFLGALLVPLAAAANHGGARITVGPNAIMNGEFTWCASELAGECLEEHGGGMQPLGFMFQSDFVANCAEEWVLEATARFDATSDSSSSATVEVTLDDAYAEAGTTGGGPGAGTGFFPVEFLVSGIPYAGWFSIDEPPYGANLQVVHYTSFAFDYSLSGRPVVENSLPGPGGFSLDGSGVGPAMAFRGFVSCDITE